MNRPEFESYIARMREQIAELPADKRAALEELARETVERHEQIRRSSLEGHRAMERLELAYERLGEACQRIVGLAREAGETLERMKRTPEPGLN